MSVRVQSGLGRGVGLDVRATRQPIAEGLAAGPQGEAAWHVERDRLGELDIGDGQRALDAGPLWLTDRGGDAISIKEGQHGRQQSWLGPGIVVDVHQHHRPPAPPVGALKAHFRSRREKTHADEHIVHVEDHGRVFHEPVVVREPQGVRVQWPEDHGAGLTRNVPGGIIRVGELKKYPARGLVQPRLPGSPRS